MSAQDIFPDPYNQITPFGNTSGTGAVNGPGFASVTFTSKQPITRTRTNSGSLFSRMIMYHQWNINITYNELTKAQFDPIYAFLLEKRGSLKPFQLMLPQYRTMATNTGIALPSDRGTGGAITDDGTNTGSTQLLVNNSSAVDISIGDLFTIQDSLDSTHTKAYKVVRVEIGAGSITTTNQTLFDTNTITSTSHGLATGQGIQFYGTALPTVPTAVTAGTTYFARRIDANNFDFYSTKAEAENTSATTGKVTWSNPGSPNAAVIIRKEGSDLHTNTAYGVVDNPFGTEARITFTPGLSKAVSSNNDTVINFNNPTVSVISAGDSTSYSLNVNNLYKLSAKFEEAHF